MQNSQKFIKDTLGLNFEKRRVSKLIKHYVVASGKGLEENWEQSLEQSGKFIEVAMKMLWIYSGKPLPNARDIKIGNMARGSLDGQISKSELSDDSLRLSIPRAIIYVYDIVSNRGGRHDSDIYNPSKVDALTVMPVCTWILVELIRHCSHSLDDPDKIKKIITNLVDEKAPFFEKFKDRIYVNKKTKSANECALLILYKLYPERVDKKHLSKCLALHDYKRSSLHLERMGKYIDLDSDGNILLRVPGIQQAEEILAREQR